MIYTHLLNYMLAANVEQCAPVKQLFGWSLETAIKTSQAHSLGLSNSEMGVKGKECARLAHHYGFWRAGGHLTEKSALGNPSSFTAHVLLVNTNKVTFQTSFLSHSFRYMERTTLATTYPIFSKRRNRLFFFFPKAPVFPCLAIFPNVVGTFYLNYWTVLLTIELIV